MFKNKSIAGTYFISTAIILFMLFATLGYFWIYQEQKKFLTESNKLRSDFIESQRRRIKTEVENTIEYIAYKKSKTNKRVRQQIKSRVNEAHAIATHICNLYQDNHSTQELAHMVKEALCALRYNNGRGYYFATSLTGTEELLTHRPQPENKAANKIQDIRGQYVIKEMIQIAKEKGEGFYEYFWTKPEKTRRDFPKISFVKRFEPLNWCIGTGEYLDDMEKDIKKEVLERISNVRFGKDGYIFVFKYDGTYVSHIDPQFIGKNMINVTDLNGVKINRRFLEAATVPEGIYINYVWEKPSSGIKAPKLAFAKSFEAWEWIIGTGVYMDDVEKTINKKLEAYLAGVRNQITFILCLFALSILITILILRYFLRNIKTGIKVFAEFFKKSAVSNEKINPLVIPFSEFRTLADLSNKMVDDRKRKDKALRESEERFRNLSHATFEGIVLHDKGWIIEANEQFYKMYGYTRQELADKNILRTLVDPDSMVMMKNKVDARDFGPYEVTCLKKNGSTFPVEIRVRLMGYQGREVRMAAIRDLSEQQKVQEQKKELEARLRRAEKMEAIGTLAGGVAHDLNNVLTGLVSYPDLLLMDLPEDSDLRDPILTIQNSGKKAAAIVQDLLTLARRGVAVSKVINLNDLITDYLKSPEHGKLKSFHPRAEFETNLQTDLLNIMGSPVHLSKTIMNLISNAVESINDHGVVSISTKNRYIDTCIKGYDEVREGDYVILSVTDSGSGISEGDLEKIFEPFYTKKTMGRSGTGLGMAVVWGTVKDHDGYINVESQEGQGTKFTLFFPVTRKAVEKDEVLSIDDYMGNGEKILVVDDVSQQIEIASALLQKLGYVVDAVSSGEDAVEYMKDNSADIIILDMIMDPGIDGLDTYKRILELNPGQRAIIASGFSETERIKEAQRLGAGEYVKKPYTLEKIGIAVKTELKRERI
ncbi:cache domain-containing protein [uncultured Desulfobacter sp.]|uniref:cache domain-containing protein n=1 Tax=uncultured Desulfobacter sp. TaxID=240139 RepID=UPI002AA69EF0|nr:cache domain-containing protein [uncultured Desulfobacter sp.]